MNFLSFGLDITHDLPTNGPSYPNESVVTHR
jgi:hypothetical protein